jgi:hypothetical protein
MFFLGGIFHTTVTVGGRVDEYCCGARTHTQRATVPPRERKPICWKLGILSPIWHSVPFSAVFHHFPGFLCFTHWLDGQERPLQATKRIS